MKTAPVIPGEWPTRVATDPAAPPPEQALVGNGLPHRWTGQNRFVIFETGFGAGEHFLATWAAWAARPPTQRPQRLFYLAVEAQPLRRPDLGRAGAAGSHPERAAQLLAQWPPSTHDLHTLSFESGAVTLLLALGDLPTWLPEWVAQVDAFFCHSPRIASPRLAGQADGWEAGVAKACARLAAPGATLTAFGPAVHWTAPLRSAGFDWAQVPGSDLTPATHHAQFRPQAAHAAQRQAPAGRVAAPVSRSALVIGAGLAGAAAARALAAQGLRVTVLEQSRDAATECSGNPAGLFHPVVHAHDGAHAQLLRAACHRSSQLIGALVRDGQVPGDVAGLLRATSRGDDDAPSPVTDPGGSAGASAEPAAADATVARMQSWLQRHGLPPDQAQAWSAEQAATQAGLAGVGPAWWFPQAGWVSPPALVHHWLSAPGIALRTQQAVAALAPGTGTDAGTAGWQAFDATGRLLAQADIVVLANAHGMVPLLAPHLPEAQHWPLRRSRGQISWWPTEAARQAGLPLPHRPLVSGAYAMGLPPGLGGGLLCGATQQEGDDDATVRTEDHRANLARLAELLGQAVDTEAALQAQPRGRVGWRLACEDRLPLLGPVPLPAVTRSHLRRQEQPRHVPRIPGLYVLTALGSRGITWAPLLGEALAAWVTGAPQSLPASLLDAVDVARLAARAVRQTGHRGPADRPGD